MEFPKYFLISVVAPEIVKFPEIIKGFYRELSSYCSELDEVKPIILCGYFRTPHQDIDVYPVMQLNYVHERLTFLISKIECSQKHRSFNRNYLANF
jgi:exonuclease III